MKNEINVNKLIELGFENGNEGTGLPELWIKIIGETIITVKSSREVFVFNLDIQKGVQISTYQINFDIAYLLEFFKSEELNKSKILLFRFDERKSDSYHYLVNRLNKYTILFSILSDGELDCTLCNLEGKGEIPVKCRTVKELINLINFAENI